MWQLTECLFVLALVGSSLSDVYLHIPRGSNNRLDENSANRKNANRMFDSQVGYKITIHAVKFIQMQSLFSLAKYLVGSKRLSHVCFEICHAIYTVYSKFIDNNYSIC